MSRIKLGDGSYTKVDKLDAIKFGAFFWQNQSGYASLCTYSKGHRFTLKLHRLIAGAKGDQEVDHINGDTLDNRRANLRVVVRAKNALNRKLNKNNTSGHSGVCWYRGRWQAQIKYAGVTMHIGMFRDKEAAAIARHWAEEFFFGEFKREKR